MYVYVYIHIYKHAAFLSWYKI